MSTCCCALLPAPLVAAFPTNTCASKIFCSIYEPKPLLSPPLRLRLPRPLPTEANSKEKKKKWECNCCFATQPSTDFVVVNFYRFVYIQNPQHEVAKHLSFLQGLDICGRIYVNEQGINAQYSGLSKDALAYVEWLRETLDFLMCWSRYLHHRYEWDIWHFNGAQRPQMDCFRRTSFGLSGNEDPSRNL